jgi:heme oxygenase (mycobilin-producing)
MLVVMVRIPIGSSDEGARVEERFRNRAGLVDIQPGFISFELLKGDGEYISMTRWASREDLNNWMQSEGNAQAHGRRPHPTGGGHPHSGPLKEPPAEQASGPSAQGSMPGSVIVYEVVIPPKGSA